MINATSFSTTYVDNYLSTNPSSGYFFGNLSVVIHTGNTTRYGLGIRRHQKA